MRSRSYWPPTRADPPRPDGPGGLGGRAGPGHAGRAPRADRGARHAAVRRGGRRCRRGGGAGGRTGAGPARSAPPGARRHPPRPGRGVAGHQLVVDKRETTVAAAWPRPAPSTGRPGWSSWPGCCPVSAPAVRPGATPRSCSTAPGRWRVTGGRPERGRGSGSACRPGPRADRPADEGPGQAAPARRDRGDRPHRPRSGGGRGAGGGRHRRRAQCRDVDDRPLPQLRPAPRRGLRHGARRRPRTRPARGRSHDGDVVTVVDNEVWRGEEQLASGVRRDVARARSSTSKRPGTPSGPSWRSSPPTPSSTSSGSTIWRRTAPTCPGFGPRSRIATPSSWCGASTTARTSPRSSARATCAR